MTPILLGMDIIKAGLHRRTGGFTFRRVTGGERQGGTGMGHHPERGVWSEGREGSIEDMRKCLEISMLELCQIW